MLENMFEKALKQVKRLTMVYYPEKKVDRDDLCPINIMCFKFKTEVVIISLTITL